MNDIEPGIRPLVDALNATGIVSTFSSCEGHFDPDQQTLVDRNLAYVRFVPTEGTPVEQVETALGQWLVAYKKKHGLLPVRVIGYKLFTPVDKDIDVTFVVELHPFNRFDLPSRKRADIDRATAQVVTLLNLFISSRYDDDTTSHPR